jgi:hypothetical protein
MVNSEPVCFMQAKYHVLAVDSSGLSVVEPRFLCVANGLRRLEDAPFTSCPDHGVKKMVNSFKKEQKSS